MDMDIKYLWTFWNLWAWKPQTILSTGLQDW